jgi:pilus assembly protein CpaC
MFLEKLGSLQPVKIRWQAEFGRHVCGGAYLLLLLTITAHSASAQISPPPSDQRPAARSNANSADPLRLESPEVSGRVDASLSPNVEQVLRPQYHIEIERRHSQLVITNRKVRRIAITDSTIANFVQYSESEISIVGLELGRTDLTLWFEEEESPSIYEITVVRDASLEEQRTIDFGRLERRLKTLYPNSIVALIPVASQVIVRGQAYDGEEAANIMQVVRTEVIRSLRRGAATDDDLGLTGLGGGGVGGGDGGGLGGAGNNNQGQNFRDIVINELVVPGEYNISLRVMVAEINRSELRNAGVDWRVLFNGGSESVGSTLGGGAGTTLSGIFENGEIEIFINWLQSNGTIKLLAEPRLTVLSGTGASILAGGEFAVPTIIGLGGGQSTTFRGFGTSLVVTPTVIDRDLIRMQVVPEFSEVNAQNAVQGIPGTNVKRVQTTVELREGQTFAIGGLISRQSLAEVSRVPLLGDIPWLGPRIFQSKSASETETELLVLVSPEIVRPMDPDDVPPVPGYNVTHPTDDDLWKRGQTEGIPDHNLYQVAPFGGGSMQGVPQGYSFSNPPQTAGPWPQQPYGVGYGQPTYSNPPPQYSQPQYSQPQYSQPQYSQPQYSQPQYSQPSMGYPPQGYAQPSADQQPYTLQPPVGAGQPYGSVPPVPAVPRSSVGGAQMGPLPPPLPPQSRVGGVPSRTASNVRQGGSRPGIKPAGWHQSPAMNRTRR